MGIFCKWWEQISALFTHRCFGCGCLTGKSKTFCFRCGQDYQAAKERTCGKCGKMLSACSCAPAVLREKRVHKLYKILPYRPQLRGNGANEMLFRIKRRFSTSAMRFCASELASAIRGQLPQGKTYLVTYAPRTQRACRKYGYDHGEVLSKMLARELGFPWQKTLIRVGGKEQKHLVGTGRKENVQGAFQPMPLADLAGMDVLLFDDLVTSGATMASAAEVLYKMGAARVVGACLYATSRK